jgi:hypothetical protein
MLPADDAYFSLPLAPPWAPEASPFRTKGVAYVNHVAYYESELPGGLDALARELRDPMLARFLRHRFATSEWYDVLPSPFFSRAAARIRGVSFAEQVNDLNVFSAKRKINRIYRALLRVVSAEAIAVALPKFAAISQDFGRAEARVVASKHVHGLRTGIPQLLVSWFALAAGSYSKAALEIAGARDVSITWSAPEREGEQGGQKLYRMPFDVRWS